MGQGRLEQQGQLLFARGGGDGEAGDGAERGEGQGLLAPRHPKDDRRAQLRAAGGRLLAERGEGAPEGVPVGQLDDGPRARRGHADGDADQQPIAHGQQVDPAGVLGPEAAGGGAQLKGLAEQVHAGICAQGGVEGRAEGGSTVHGRISKEATMS